MHPPELIQKVANWLFQNSSPEHTNPDLADLGSEYRVFEMEGKNIGANLAQILFGPDGYLYISMEMIKLQIALM